MYSLLYAHFSARHDVGYDVFSWRSGVDPVCPLVDCDHLTALLVRVGWLPRAIDKCAVLHPSYLTPIISKLLLLQCRDIAEVW